MMRRGRRALDGLDQDIRDHIERETQDNIDRGMAPEEARRRARLVFGNVALASEDTRAIWVRRWVDDLRQDVRYACRALRKNPGFATVVVLTLALGIGATTGVFSVVNGVLLRASPNPDADRLVRIVENVPAAESFRGVAMRTSAMNQDEFLWWRTQAQTLDMAVGMPVSQTLVTPDGAIRLSGLRVSANWFDIYGVRPARGRWLRQDEERPDANVIVLSTATWRQYLDSDPDVLDRSIAIGGRSYSIVGVAPAEFGRDTAFWAPFVAEPSQSNAATFVSVISRLRGGVSLEAATAEANVLGHQLRGISQEPAASPRFEIVRVQDERVARVRPALRILMVAVAAVLNGEAWTRRIGR